MSIAAHPDPAPPRGALSLALPAALALAAAMGIGRFAFTPVWPLMAQEAGLSLAQGSWLASANYAGYLLGALAAAVRPPRHPRPRRLAQFRRRHRHAGGNADPRLPHRHRGR